jgi:hypothetical protein
MERGEKEIFLLSTLDIELFCRRGLIYFFFWLKGYDEIKEGRNDAGSRRA